MVQRVEIISAKEPRRRWSDDEKRRLVAAAFAPGAVISHVARVHGVATSCLFAWRKRFPGLADGITPEATRLIPVMVDGAIGPAAPGPFDSAVPPLPRHAVITWPDGLRLEIPVGYPAAALKTLIAALRPAR
ncbi:MAG TPA: transposase [Candidatus Sulfotelmatobacter sp.]|nr:transposase [Candidatus Sulfotelmatobacter sp.]